MYSASITVMLVALALSSPRAEEPQTPKLTGHQLQKEAARCANTLYQFAVVKKDFFPAGLGKRFEDNKFYHDPAQWPPPKAYSWRVAVLPFLEQNNLYKALLAETDTFKTPAILSTAELEKRPDLKRLLGRMPEWMTLSHLKDKAGKSVYRRLIAKEKPDLFIIVESPELVDWYKGGDDLEMTEGKSLPKIGGNFFGGFFALCGDDQVRFLPSTLSQNEIRQVLITGKGVRPLRCKDGEELIEDIKGLGLSK